MKFDINNRPNDLDQVQQTVALELALGCGLPKAFSAWPVALVSSWNDACDAGYITGKTLGDMARGFLAYRASKL